MADEIKPVQLQLLGTPTLTYNGNIIKLERRKAIALAAYLALNGQSQHRDVLAALLWPENHRETARTTLRSVMRSLTSQVPITWIHADRMTLNLDVSVTWVDVVEFTELLKQSQMHDHPAARLCDRCAETLLQANDLYRDDFMNGFYLADSIEFENWQYQQREWLRREYANVQRRLSLHYAAQEQTDLAFHFAHRWLACDALHEPAHRHLMRLYSTNGQRSEALRQYQQCVHILDTELATPPEHETVQLYESILNSHINGKTRQSVSPTSPIANIIPPMPSLVVGREEALDELKRRLGIGSEAMHSTTVIHGWPGVGKSTTAAMLTHDTAVVRAFPDGILWTSLGESATVRSEISVWAETLGIREQIMETRSLEDITAQLAAIARDKRILLVIDDVWQVEDALPFKIGGQNCATVMTSRLLDVAIALAPTAADVYRLPVLTEAAGLELLARLTPETVEQHPNEARALVQSFEGLPLAIHVAGRLLNTEAKMGWGVTELLAELRDGAGVLAAQPPSDVLRVGRDTSPTVAALLKRSTDLLDAETRQQFALLGLFVPKPATFHLEAMALAWDVDDPKPIARRLVNRGLLEPVSGGRFQLHALMVLHARSLLKMEPGNG